MRPLLSVVALLVLIHELQSQEPPKKHAVLVAVTTYEAVDFNKPPKIEYPEEDAKELGDLLRQAGYTVKLLLGSQAKQAAIKSALEGIKSEGNATGCVVVGFFGHGVELGIKLPDGKESTESYFCPYDCEMRERRQADGGKLLLNGKPMIEPDPKTAIGMTSVFTALKTCKAGNRVLVADCCRDDPNAARGTRSFGANIEAKDIPYRTAALFACSQAEKAHEDPGSRHGIFTKCLLDELRGSQGRMTAHKLGERLDETVPALIKQLSQGRAQQTPVWFSSGTVDLQLVSIAKPPMPKMESRTGVPPVKPTLLIAPFTAAEAKAKQEAWVKYLGRSSVTETNVGGQTMVLIPAGEFMMGCSVAEAKAVFEQLKRDSSKEGAEILKEEFFTNSAPPRKVRITQPLLVSQHEVTRGQFRKFVESDGYKTEAEKDGDAPNWRDAGIEQTDEHPVINVTWNDAVAYCKWLSRATGKEHRLLTEAEWEYCCRAGTTTQFNFGDNGSGLHQHGNVMDAAYKREGLPEFIGKAISGNDGYVFTAPVGRFAANGFGLQDMHGNVWEWCADWYGSYDSVVDDPRGPSGGSMRVDRGGSWNDAPAGARSAIRSWFVPAYRSNDLGFRVASSSVSQ